MKKNKVQKVLDALPFYLVALVVALVFVIPLIWMVASSLRTPGLPPPRGMEWLPQPLAWNNMPPDEACGTAEISETVASTIATFTSGAGSRRSRNKARKSTANPAMMAKGTTQAGRRRTGAGSDEVRDRESREVFMGSREIRKTAEPECGFALQPRQQGAVTGG